MNVRVSVGLTVSRKAVKVAVRRKTKTKKKRFLSW